MESIDLSLSLGSKFHLQDRPTDKDVQHDLGAIPRFPRHKNVPNIFGRAINEGIVLSQAQNLAVGGGSSPKPKRKAPAEPIKRWTQQEHEAFLMGLRRHGRGQWKSISINFVPTKSPSQISSHAQNYFRRRRGKDGTIDFTRLLAIPKLPEGDEVAKPPPTPIISATRPIYRTVNMVPDEESSTSCTPNPNYTVRKPMELAKAEMSRAVMAGQLEPEMLKLPMTASNYPVN